MEFLHSYERTDKMYARKVSTKCTGKFYEKRTPVCVCVFIFCLLLKSEMHCIKFFFSSLFCVLHCRFRPPRYVVGEMSRQAANMMKTYLRLNFMWHLKCCCFECMQFFCCCWLFLVWWKLVFSNVIYKMERHLWLKGQTFFFRTFSSIKKQRHNSMDKYKGMD